MCIAIYKPAGVVLSKELLQNCADNNADGCGFAYISESHTGHKKIKIKKTLDFDVFYKQYERAQAVAGDQDFLIHFRIKTQGLISKENCHPFKVNNDVVFIHNGVIPMASYDTIKSDTVLFNEDTLRGLPKGWEKNESILALLEESIGNSKLVTLDIEGGVSILGEKKGEWKDGCWFSNTSYKKRVPYRYQGTQWNKSTYGTSGRSVKKLPFAEKKAKTPILELCDECFKPFDGYEGEDIKGLDWYHKDGDFHQLCQECADKMMLDNFDTITHEMYEEYSQGELSHLY